MRSIDKNKFVDLLQGVHDFYGKDMSEFAAQVWWQACQSFDLEVVSKAFSAHLMDPDRGQWMPKPADLVRTLHGTRTDRSLIAWGKVLEAMKLVGAYQSVVFDDGLIHAAIQDIGGWVAICRGEVDELPHLQRRFCQSYQAYATREDVHYPPKLSGEHELMNSLRGHPVMPPVMLGNPAVTGAVLLEGSDMSPAQMIAPWTDKAGAP